MQPQGVRLNATAERALSDNSAWGIFPVTAPSVSHLLREHSKKVESTQEYFCVVCLQLRGLAKGSARSHRAAHVETYQSLKTQVDKVTWQEMESSSQA